MVRRGHEAWAVARHLGKIERAQVTDQLEETSRQPQTRRRDELGRGRGVDELAQVGALEAEYLIMVARRVPRQQSALQLEYHVEERPHVVPPP